LEYVTYIICCNVGSHLNQIEGLFISTKQIVISWKCAIHDYYRPLTGKNHICCVNWHSSTLSDLWVIFEGSLRSFYVQYLYKMLVTVLYCIRYAFLTFGSRPRMLDAFNRYSSRRLVADGQVVHVIKYELPKTIPCGMYIWIDGRMSPNTAVIFCFSLCLLPSAHAAHFSIQPWMENIYITLPTLPCSQYILTANSERYPSILCFIFLFWYSFHYNKYYSSSVIHSALVTILCIIFWLYNTHICSSWNFRTKYW